MDLRLAEIDDADAIRSIYNLEVTGSTVTFDLVPRSLEDQRLWIEEHDGAHPAIVAVDRAGVDGGGREIVGFGALSPHRPRPAYATSVENSVYVRRDRQRRGVGRALLEELLRLGTAHGFHAVFARIVDGHQASIALHEACGFVTVGVEREVGRKFGRWLDVVVMERLL